MDGAGHVDASRRTLTPESFVARFQECSGALWCIAASVLNDRSGIDDVLQESAMIALQKLEQFDASTSLTAWCGRIVQNVARNHARRDHRRRAAAADLRLVAAEPSRDEAQADSLATGAALSPDQREFDDAMVRALARIDEIARTCLLLRTLKGMTYREIAETLAIPEGTASSHVHRARRALRDLLANADVAKDLRRSAHHG